MTEHSQLPEEWFAVEKTFINFVSLTSLYHLILEMSMAALTTTGQLWQGITVHNGNDVTFIWKRRVSASTSPTWERKAGDEKVC